ncbi:MAG: efflux RND transporter permease subunit, partial [Bradymonadia bacterium]
SIRRAFETIDEHVGGTANVQLLIRGRSGDGLGTGMRDLETLQALEKIEADIKAYRHPEMGEIVGSSISLLDVVKESHQALSNTGSSGYRLPDDNRGVADMLFMFENAGAEEMGQLATSDLRTSQMTVQLKWLEASQFRALTPYIDSSIQEHTPNGVIIKATGAVYTLVSTIGNLIWDLLSSFGVAFLVITALMIVLLGGFKLGLIAMVPNLMPVVVIMGIMHVTGIPIDMNNILIASISMGLAVDDTIHLLHHFRMNHRATGNVEVSIRRAMEHSGRAMVSTTMILMLGFFVYMGAEMANIQRFGLLIGLTALLALLIDLFFAPALLRTFYKRNRAANLGVEYEN